MGVRDEVLQRSNGQCEAMVAVHTTWARCGIRPVEVHHCITRARGGRVLDEVGETYHLLALCPTHHRMADGQEAYESGLLLDGYVLRENDRVVYYGSDDYLLARYPQ